MDLVRYDSNGIELIIDRQSGEVFASQSAIARMCQVADTTIMRWATSAKISPITAEIPTGKGLRTSALYNEDAIYQSFAKYKPELLVQCAKAGIRVYLHRLAGFKVESSATMGKKTTTIDALLETVAILKQQETRLNEIENKLEKAKWEAFEQETRLGARIQSIDWDLQDIEKKLKRQESEIKRVFSPDGDYYTIRGYASLIGVRLALRSAISLGRRAAFLSRSQGYAIEIVRDPRYGTVNIYHINILRQLDWHLY